jgi:hypothetical protein
MSVYSQLSNDEKNLWGRNAGYDGFSSLYRYLYREPNLDAKPKIYNALKQTVGDARYNQLICQFTNVNPVSNPGASNNSINSVSTNANTVVRLIAEIKAGANEISACHDIDTLRELNRILGVVSDITTNQLNILNLYTNLNSTKAV